ncbi:MAG: cyclase family protein [Rhizobiaceae bacterium]
MCDICVMNSVKERMVSRRGFFKSAAAAGAVATVGVSTTTSALAAGQSKVMDLTHTLHPEFPTWGGDPGFAKEQVFNFKKDGFNLFNLTINEHTGTHIDAPLHFSADGTSVDEMPVESLIAPLCIVDIAARAAENADTTVTPDDLKAWISANGKIPDGACVAMHSGWGAKVATDGFRNFDGKAQHYPGFHVEAATMLKEETGAKSIAVDTLSLDPGNSADFATHYAWLPSNRFGIENVANLDKLPAAGATVFIGAPKFAGGTGGPARVIAMV